MMKWAAVGRSRPTKGMIRVGGNEEEIYVSAVDSSENYPRQGIVFYRRNTILICKNQDRLEYSRFSLCFHSFVLVHKKLRC
jgi:hypothetical protein